MDDSAKGCDSADLRSDKFLNFAEELIRGNRGWRMVGGREGDEGEGEVAFEGVGDAYDATLGYTRMGGDGLFDGACRIIRVGIYVNFQHQSMKTLSIPLELVLQCFHLIVNRKEKHR